MTMNDLQNAILGVSPSENKDEDSDSDIPSLISTDVQKSESSSSLPNQSLLSSSSSSSLPPMTDPKQLIADLMNTLEKTSAAEKHE